MVEYDQFGPQKIIHVYHPKIGMRGFVVIDNLGFGPGKGGIRMTSTVSVEEVARLARAMTWKCSLAGLPFGGAKAGIVGNDKQMSLEEKKEIVEAFAKALKQESPSQYVAAPDMNIAEQEMGWYAKANGDKKSCTGKPKKMGGIPHELGSTGFGVYQATKVAVAHKGLKLKDLTFAVEGFGNVGWFASKYLTEEGAKLVAVSDSRGTLYNKDGIDFERLAKTKQEKKTVTEYKPGKVFPNRDIIKSKADILITAAIPDLIGTGDVDDIKAKIIVCGSNIPMHPSVEELLHKKGVLVVPDFVANAGGVISSYVEYIGGTPEKMFKMVEEKITKNTKLVLGKAKKDKKCPRESAMQIAKERVMKACTVCKVV